jgi:hypothetical protein
MNIIRKIISASLIVTMMAISTGVLSVQRTLAASITSFSDTLTTEKASTVSNHTISFVTPTGVTSGQTIILTFDNSTSIAAGLTFTDIDVKDNGTNVTLAAAPSGATWGAVRTSATVITLTNGTTAVVAGHTITVLIGTNATNQTTGVNQITNGTAGTTTLALSGTFGDTGTIAMPIIANDVVAVTATVNPTITFALSTNAIDFGILATANGKWATSGAASGGTTAATATIPTAAHTMTVSTNATGGYVVAYNGATLTSGADTIAAASIAADSDGTPASAQFAASYSSAGSSTITAGYTGRATTTPTWNFVPSTATTVVTSTGPVAAEVISASYLANISGVTPAGAYATNLTYLATGTF